MGLREKLIEFQNRAETDFKNRRTFSSITRYLLAYIIFFGTTLVAGITFPVRILFRLLQPRKEGIVVMNSRNHDRIVSANSLVLLDFWADWCGPCIMMNNQLERFAKNNPRITIAKVNADLNASLLKQYVVRGIPHLILLKEGKEINRFAGAMSENELRKFTFDNATLDGSN